MDCGVTVRDQAGNEAALRGEMTVDVLIRFSSPRGISGYAGGKPLLVMPESGESEKEL